MLKSYYGKVDGEKEYYSCIRDENQNRARKNQSKYLTKDKSGIIVGGIYNVTE